MENERVQASDLAVLPGSVNKTLTRRMAVFAIEANWLRTNPANSTTSVENDLCLGAGINLRAG